MLFKHPRMALMPHPSGRGLGRQPDELVVRFEGRGRSLDNGAEEDDPLLEVAPLGLRVGELNRARDLAIRTDEEPGLLAGLADDGLLGRLAGFDAAAREKSDPGG